MIKVALLGYGKMGKTIESLIEKNYPDISVAFRISSANMHELTSTNLSAVDVAIEFSNPDAALKNIMTCFEANVPVVCGTTGWQDQLNIVKQLCIDKNYSLLYASNFSIGVNIFFELNKKLSSLMHNRPYQIRIDETHHLQKIDKPSGTAISLIQDIMASNDKYEGWQLDQQADSKSIPVYAHRKEGVPGTHSVLYQSAIDSIEIVHTAHSREGFADGAITAAQWLIGKKGYFQMKDVLAL